MPAQHTVFLFLYENVFSALNEEKAFSTFVKDSELPVLVATLKDNMLGCTVLEDGLEKH